MSGSLQLGFSDYEQVYAKKKTRRQIFLEEMEATIPWDDFHALIRPVYHQPSAKGGRPPFPLEVMLRIHLLQQWFTLSDPLMEEMLIDTPCFRRFAAIDIVSERIPDETTILNFRHLLEEHEIGDQIFEAVKQTLKHQGALLQEGTILDATIIHAPSSTKNKKGERDPEMHSVAKGNQWFFGMRCHIGVDAASGLVHSVVSTAANVQELNTAAERLHGEEKVVYGDSGHLGIEKREEFADSPCQFRIAMRPGQRRALPDTAEGRLENLFETAKAHLRAKVEHPFRVIKRQFGFQKTRYRGIKKNDHKLKMLFALANLYKIRHLIPSTGLTQRISVPKSWKSWIEDDDSGRVKLSEATKSHKQQSRAAIAWMRLRPSWSEGQGLSRVSLTCRPMSSIFFGYKSLLTCFSFIQLHQRNLRRNPL